MIEPDPVGELARILAALIARTGTGQVEISEAELAAVRVNAAISVQPPWLSATGHTVLIELHGMEPAAPPAPLPKPDPADRLPRHRNPRIGCEQLDGTWVHGRPHDCPEWLRG